MEMQQLRHLISAAKHGNIGRAAEENHITQPALTRSIKRLEQSLGAQLLDRSPTGVRPTLFGETVLEHAQVIVREAQQAIDNVKAIKGLAHGHVSLGIAASYTSYLIPDVLKKVCEILPGLNITVTSTLYDELLAGLRKADLDLVFSIFPPESDEPDLSFETLLTSHSLVHVRSDHPLANKKSVSLEELSQHGWVMADQRAVEKFFKPFFSNNGLPLPRQVIKTNSVTVIRQAMLTTGLLSILPDHLVREDVAKGSIVKINIEGLKSVSPAGLIRRARGSRSPGADELAQIIRDTCKDMIAQEGQRADPNQVSFKN